MLKNDINIPLLTTVGAVGSILLVVALLGTQAWYFWEVEGELSAKWENQGYKRVTDLKDAQRSQLAAAPKWADREKGLVYIPIDAGMAEIVKSGGKLPK